MTFIRPMEPEDAEAVAAIAAAGGAARWDAEAFRRELTLPQAYLIVAVDEQVVGFAVFWKVVDEIHLLNIAVAPERRRAGIGRLLLRTVLTVAGAHGAAAVLLEVRAANAPAQALYRAAGFRQNGRRRRYYDDGEDALLFEKALGR